MQKVRMSGMPKYAMYLMVSLVLGGCTSYRTSHLPGTDPRTPYDATRSTIAVGDVIKVVLTDGEELEGRVQDLGSESFTLTSPPGRHDLETVTLEYASIAATERREGSRGKTIGLVLLVWVLTIVPQLDY